MCSCAGAFIRIVGCKLDTEQEEARRQVAADAAKVAEQEAKEKAARAAQARKDAEVRRFVRPPLSTSAHRPLQLAPVLLLHGTRITVDLHLVHCSFVLSAAIAIPSRKKQGGRRRPRRREWRSRRRRRKRHGRHRPERRLRYVNP
jgi:hypothetical protein